MKNCKHQLHFFPVILLVFLTGCASVSVGKLDKLNAGMTETQVQGLLGRPAGVIPVEGGTVYRYDLWSVRDLIMHPYELVFDQNGVLRGWYRDEAAYYMNKSIQTRGLFQANQMLMDQQRLNLARQQIDVQRQQLLQPKGGGIFRGGGIIDPNKTRVTNTQGETVGYIEN